MQQANRSSRHARGLRGRCCVPAGPPETCGCPIPLSAARTHHARLRTTERCGLHLLGAASSPAYGQRQPPLQRRACCNSKRHRIDPPARPALKFSSLPFSELRGGFLTHSITILVDEVGRGDTIKNQSRVMRYSIKLCSLNKIDFIGPGGISHSGAQPYGYACLSRLFRQYIPCWYQ